MNDTRGAGKVHTQRLSLVLTCSDELPLDKLLHSLRQASDQVLAVEVDADLASSRPGPTPQASASSAPAADGYHPDPSPSPTASIHTSIVIPAFNEAAALPSVLAAARNIVDPGYEVIVVDDGSTDNTVAVASQFSCWVISHQKNAGKGAAMKTGIRHARGHKVVFVDGDATYPIDAIPIIVALLDDFDMVRGVRVEGRDNIPSVNRLGNSLFDSVIKLVHDVDGGDVLTGLYGLHRQTLLDMRLQSDGFDIETEIVVKAKALGLRSECIPIQYSERIGEKKLKPLKDGAQILTRVLALAAVVNPFAMYVLPGLMLWLVAAIALLLLWRGPVLTPIGFLTTNTYIVSAMTILAGFQLVVLGLVVNLYAAASGLGTPSRTLSLVAQKIPRRAGVAWSALLILAGFAWSVALVVEWAGAGFGEFRSTEPLVGALALLVWGVQLLCTMFFLSLFAGLPEFSPPAEITHEQAHPRPVSSRDLSAEPTR